MEISRAGLNWIEQDKGWGGPSVQGPFDWYADANHLMASFLSEWTFLLVEQLYKVSYLFAVDRLP